MSRKYDYLKHLFSDEVEGHLLKDQKEKQTQETNSSAAKLQKAHRDCHQRIKKYLQSRDQSYSFVESSMEIKINYDGK